MHNVVFHYLLDIFSPLCNFVGGNNSLCNCIIYASDCQDFQEFLGLLCMLKFLNSILKLKRLLELWKNQIF